MGVLRHRWALWVYCCYVSNCKVWGFVGYRVVSGNNRKREINQLSISDFGTEPTHSLALAGTLPIDGQCTGTQYSDTFGTWNNVVVQTSVTITLPTIDPINLIPPLINCLVPELVQAIDSHVKEIVKKHIVTAETNRIDINSNTANVEVEKVPNQNKEKSGTDSVRVIKHYEEKCIATIRNAIPSTKYAAQSDPMDIEPDNIPQSPFPKSSTRTFRQLFENSSDSDGELFGTKVKKKGKEQKVTSIDLPNTTPVTLDNVSVLCLSTEEIEAEKSGWSFDPNTQYHVQTDEGPERYFRFQTLNGQYRKEKRLLDGTVIGTEGWLDPLGYLRLKDYIADNNGFRILRSKMVYVGKNRPIYDSITETKSVPAQNGILVEPTRPPNPFSSDYYISTTAKPPISSSNNDYYYNVNRVSFSFKPHNFNDYHTYRNSLQRPNAAPISRYDRFKPNLQLSTAASRSSSTAFPEFDGTYNVVNGFQYYLKRQYHEEEQGPTGANVGSFGYIDPFGIRRVIYYKTDPQTGSFVHQKNNKYVGFAATPYDVAPSLPNLYKRN
ncbi:hypothetical protein WH47_11016 [Habropoda laboriosa]|uniref:Cuticle protein 6 n=1 Tax=Habropoda laboriosa TaxID=597456 RepID=A0A0L7QMA5_9HYME|nr:hypothetical protein WH47_11016 [Habropoda laboriosa]